MDFWVKNGVGAKRCTGSPPLQNRCYDKLRGSTWMDFLLDFSIWEMISLPSHGAKWCRRFQHLPTHPSSIRQKLTLWTCCYKLLSCRIYPPFSDTVLYPPFISCIPIFWSRKPILTLFITTLTLLFPFISCFISHDITVMVSCISIFCEITSYHS